MAGPRQPGRYWFGSWGSVVGTVTPSTCREEHSLCSFSSSWQWCCCSICSLHWSCQLMMRCLVGRAAASRPTMFWPTGFVTTWVLGRSQAILQCWLSPEMTPSRLDSRSWCSCSWKRRHMRRTILKIRLGVNLWLRRSQRRFPSQKADVPVLGCWRRCAAICARITPPRPSGGLCEAWAAWSHFLRSCPVSDRDVSRVASWPRNRVHRTDFC
mmetsp:Transcript_19454/g.46925  ORF Transcript_19454/g.46925 Transcript_19454/m.46925 type:complete len:212 (+) Transcript_19454:1520-2155(+)